MAPRRFSLGTTTCPDQRGLGDVVLPRRCQEPILVCRTGRERAVNTNASTGQVSIQGIQYLRAIAALMVVFHHARWFFPTDCILFTAPWAEFGSRGVDIFFVISGYVMTVTTRNYSAHAGHRIPQAVGFMVKRFIRVVPLYWIATLWTAKRLIWHGEARLPLLEDFLFVPHFSERGHGLIWPYLFQGWTINYELFFYALFAISMLVGRQRYLFLSLTLLTLVLLGTVLNITHAQTNIAAVIFYTSNLLLEFLMGVWLSLWMQGRVSRLPRPILMGVTLIGFLVLAVPNDDTIRGFADGIVAVAIVWTAVLWGDAIDIPLLRRLGDASYSIYLFHMTIYGASLWVFKSLDLLQPTLFHMLTVIAMQIAFASLLGLGVHRYVEKPVLKWLRSMSTARWRRSVV
jgi:exopolysaccharide production protein ExoZ